MKMARTKKRYGKIREEEHNIPTNRETAPPAMITPIYHHFSFCYLVVPLLQPKRKTPAKKAAAKKAPAAKKTPAKKAATPAAKAATPAAKKAAASTAKKAPAAKAAAASTAKKPAAKRVKKDEEAEGEEGAEASASAAAKPRRAKEMKPLDMVEAAMKAYRWWEAQPLPKGVKWRVIEHRGVLFPPAYVPHGVKMRYAGAPVDLTPEQEELATMYAAMPPDGPQLGTPETAKVFNDNFFRDFREVLGKDHTIQRLKDCDFEVSHSV